MCIWRHHFLDQMFTTITLNYRKILLKIASESQESCTIFRRIILERHCRFSEMETSRSSVMFTSNNGDKMRRVAIYEVSARFYNKNANEASNCLAVYHNWLCSKRFRARYIVLTIKRFPSTNFDINHRKVNEQTCLRCLT